MTDKTAATGTGENFSLQIVRKALLREADKGFKRNFLTSPLSISFFLNLFAAGNKGPILDQFLEFLDAKSLDELHNRTRKLRDLATVNGNKEYGEPVVFTANGVWINHTCPVKDSFRKILESVYQIDANALDFKNKSFESAAEINSWVLEKTNGLIKGIVSPTRIPKKSIIVANTLYFKAAWEKPFCSSFTKESVFHLLNGEKVDVEFMNECGSHYSYCSSFNGFKILKIPYEYGCGRKFYMYFFLPDETNGLRKLIDGFNSVPEFLNQDFSMKYMPIRRLVIPKFKFENKFDISNLMRALGFAIPDLKETEMIDNIPDYDSNPMGVSQKAFIAVDEDGTEAAAVTYDEDMGYSLDSEEPPPPPEIDFIADHPFLFMIREDYSKVPFFIGAVVHPGKDGEEEDEDDDEY